MRHLAFVVLAWSASAAAQPSDPPSREAVLEQRLEELEQRQKALEQKLADTQKQLQREPPPAAAAASEQKPAEPVQVSIGPRGLQVETADRAFALRIRGLFQADGRLYFQDKADFNDTFLVRRAMPILEGTFFKVADFKFLPDFGQGRFTLYDAYVDVHPWNWLHLRGGKFNPGLGLERLQCMANLTFVELGYPNGLIPIRDIGAELWGEVANSSFVYSMAVFNGTPGGTFGDFDVKNSVEFVGRLFAHPFRPLHKAAVENFGLGFAASYGTPNGTPATPNLSTYKTIGQQTFFTYLTDTTPSAANTVVAAGERYRFAPQLYYYVGPFGLLSEYVYHAEKLRKGGAVATLVNQAWQIQISFVLTLDRAGYDGVIPKRPFDLSKRHFGAFELAGRYNEMRLDDGAFPTFADPTLSAKQVRSFGVAFNWYLTQNTRMGVNYERSDFKGGAVTGNREPENALFGRMQLGF